MIDLLPIFLRATPTLQKHLTEWFASYPPGMPWTVVSDYCIGDENKKNDVFSFVIIANHDTAANISEYLARVAPRDIKNSKGIPLGLVQYLTCPQPITFSVSFVLTRETNLLRDYLKTEDMAAFMPEARRMLESMRDNTPPSASVDFAFFDDAIKRFDAFAHDFTKKQLNAKLARQIHLASAFVATLFHLVTQSTKAGYLRWISDRDALIERHNNVVYDLAYMYFALMISQLPDLVPDAKGRVILPMPQVSFEIPEKTGEHRFDDLIRLPDYLAGTLADIDLTNISFTKDKFGVMLRDVFINSPNNWVVQLSSDKERITARSVRFQV